MIKYILIILLFLSVLKGESQISLNKIGIEYSVSNFQMDGLVFWRDNSFKFNFVGNEALAFVNVNILERKRFKVGGIFFTGVRSPWYTNVVLKDPAVFTESYAGLAPFYRKQASAAEREPHFFSGGELLAQLFINEVHSISTGIRYQFFLNKVISAGDWISDSQIYYYTLDYKIQLNRKINLSFGGMLSLNPFHEDYWSPTSDDGVSYRYDIYTKNYKAKIGLEFKLNRFK